MRSPFPDEVQRIAAAERARLAVVGLFALGQLALRWRALDEGFALGLDRTVALTLGLDNIREVIAFPKTASGVCPLTGAPTPVDAKLLDELGLVAKGEE